MTSQDINTLIPQIPGESNRAYRRFIIYLKKGFEDLEELHTYLEKEEKEIAVTYGTLRNDSSENNWSKRSEKYYQIKDQEIQEEMEQLFKQLNTKGIHDMQEFLDELQKLFHEVVHAHQEGEYSVYTMFKTFKEYITCYRQATEIYYINSRHQIYPDNENNQTTQTDDKLRDISHTLYGDQI
jgi:hypothetical protein